MAAQVKSRKRVQEHGEVFTNEREVNAMLDMVKQETERIDSRFLEPACRDRLYSIVEERYQRVVKRGPNPDFLDAIGFVLERNILNGNALSLKAVDEDGNDTDEPIIFSEWSVVTGDRVKRRDFRLDEMLEGNVERGQTRTLFGADMTSAVDWEYDEETKTFIPKPIREFPLTSLYEVHRHD